MIEVWKKQEQPAKVLGNSPILVTQKQHHAFISSTAVLKLGQSDQVVSQLAYVLYHLDSGWIIFKKLLFLLLWRENLFLTSRDRFIFKGILLYLTWNGVMVQQTFYWLMGNETSVAEFYNRLHLIFSKISGCTQSACIGFIYKDFLGSRIWLWHMKREQHC